MMHFLSIKDYSTTFFYRPIPNNRIITSEDSTEPSRVVDWHYEGATFTLIDLTGDNGFGLSTDSQTNTSISYSPTFSGIHDCAVIIESFANNCPLVHDIDMVTPSESF